MKTKLSILGVCAVAVAALLGVFTTNVSATEASATLAPCCETCVFCVTGSGPCSSSAPTSCRADGSASQG